MQILPSIPQKRQEKRQDLRFLIITECGELLDLAIHLSRTYDVLFCILDKEYKKIGEGLVETIDDWHEYMGQDYIFVMDGCDNAKLQDWLREQGEYVVGSSEGMADLENDRQKAQDWFNRELDFWQPDSHNFNDFDSAMEHVSKSKTALILKQNGDAPKSINHKGKFEDGYDMLFFVLLVSSSLVHVIPVLFLPIISPILDNIMNMTQLFQNVEKSYT